MSRESFGEGQWSKVQENIKFCPKRDQLSWTLIIWGYNIRMPLTLKVSQYSLTNVQCPLDWHCAWLLSKGYTSIFNSEQSVEVLRRGAPADWDQLYLPGPVADNLTGRWAQSSRTVDGTRTRVKPGSTLRMSVNPGEPGVGSRRVQLSLAGCHSLSLSGSTCSALQCTVAASAADRGSLMAHSHPWLSRAFVLWKISRKSRRLQKF